MNAQQRHSVTAYAILFAVTGLLLVLIVRPMWLDWRQVQVQNEALKHEIQVHQSARLTGEAANVELRRQLSMLVAQGDLVALSPDEAAHLFQMTIKSVLLRHGIRLKRLAPARKEVAAELYAITLELSFQAPPQAVQGLLEELTHPASKARIDLLSLRKVPLPVSFREASQNSLLEGRLLVSTLSHSMADAVPIEQEVVEQEGGTARTNPNRLTAVFDAKARLKFFSPSTEHYRVAALTVSDQKRIAVVIDLASGRSYRLQAGDYLDAWKVLEIDTQRVRLAAGDLLGELTLNK